MSKNNQQTVLEQWMKDLVDDKEQTKQDGQQGASQSPQTEEQFFKVMLS